MLTSDFYTNGMEFFQILKPECASRPMHAKLHIWQMRALVCGVLCCMVVGLAGLSGLQLAGPGCRRADGRDGGRVGGGAVWQTAGRLSGWADERRAAGGRNMQASERKQVSKLNAKQASERATERASKQLSLSKVEQA